MHAGESECCKHVRSKAPKMLNRFSGRFVDSASNPPSWRDSIAASSVHSELPERALQCTSGMINCLLSSVLPRSPGWSSLRASCATTRFGSSPPYTSGGANRLLESETWYPRGSADALAAKRRASIVASATFIFGDGFFLPSIGIGTALLVVRMFYVEAG